MGLALHNLIKKTCYSFSEKLCHELCNSLRINWWHQGSLHRWFTTYYIDGVTKQHYLVANINTNNKYSKCEMSSLLMITNWHSKYLPI